MVQSCPVQSLVQLLDSSGHAATAPRLGAPADGYYLPFSVTSANGFKEVAVTVAEYTETYTYTSTDNTGQAVGTYTDTYTIDSEKASLGLPATGETFGASNLLYHNAPYQTTGTTTVLACPPGTLMTGMSVFLFPFYTVELLELSVYCREGEWPGSVTCKHICQTATDTSLIGA